MLKKLSNYFKKVKRARRIKKLKKKIPPYLLKDFEVELNYKLWTTKGARFSASRRNQILHRLSGQCIGYLSAYLIIVGLVKLYGLNFWLLTLTEQQVNFTSMAFSVLILLFSQLESSENYILKSERYHNCALDIAELYNKLRFAKTYQNDNPDKQTILLDISNDYDRILKKYENHIEIDYSRFQLQKPDYFELDFFDRVFIKTEYYCRVHLRYHILIYGPLIVFITTNLYLLIFGNAK